MSVPSSDQPAARPATTGSGEAKVTKELVIENQLGMHARPSAQFVKIANRHRAEIWVEKDGEQVNGKSIMGLMMLAAGQGTKVKGQRGRPRCRRGAGRAGKPGSQPFFRAVKPLRAAHFHPAPAKSAAATPRDAGPAARRGVPRRRAGATPRLLLR